MTKAGLDDLFSECAVVSVQAPSTAETRHMIGARQLGLLRDGACFVNTARSWVIDYDALLAELQTGRIQAYAASHGSPTASIADAARSQSRGASIECRPRASSARYQSSNACRMAR